MTDADCCGASRSYSVCMINSGGFGGITSDGSFSSAWHSGHSGRFVGEGSGPGSSASVMWASPISLPCVRSDDESVAVF